MFWEKISKKELQTEIEYLKGKNQHLQRRNQRLEQNISLMKKLAERSLEEFVQNEEDSFFSHYNSKYDFLIDNKGLIRGASEKYLKISGYTIKDIKYVCYHKLLKGVKDKIESIFNNPEGVTEEIIILGKPERKDASKYKEIVVKATTTPVFLYNENFKGHRIKRHAFTKVYLGKIKVNKIDEKKDKQKISEKVLGVIKKAEKDVNKWIKKHKN